MSEQETFDNYTDVAIVGMAGRFPGAGNIEEFWRNLRDGVESITFFTDEELIAAGVSPLLLSDPNYVKARPVLEGAELFDASFFGLTPREAEIMDPQQRIFLECAWEALEHAGYDAEGVPGRVGVYAGLGFNTYLLSNLYSNRRAIEAISGNQSALGNDKDFLATRVSYKLNLRGPAVTVQTACSTSLVAVHMACQSLLNGECGMALAGGITVVVPQRMGYRYAEGGIESPDGHCRAFDAQAKGTVGGSGAGVVVLKRLEDALADGDTIHAVIKGSAINNDGSLKVGYTAPSVEGQAEVIGEALHIAGVEARTVTYVEAHGTGTVLGDPIEIAALTQAFRATTEEKQFCAIGSVKTNVGHLDTAAGVAGLIKTVLALKHRQIPPSLNFEEPNPALDLADSPFYVNTRLSEWKAAGSPLRAGVSSFGIGGTNAHVVVEEPPAPAPAPDPRHRHLLLLSARTETALDAATRNLAEHLRQNPHLNLGDVAYTLQAGRKSFDHRRALVCSDAADASAALEAQGSRRVLSSVRETGDHPVVFMFPGQGTQHVNMALGLYEVEETFRRHFDECAEVLRGHLGFDLREAVYPRGGNPDEAARRLTQTSVAQPALFAVEYALARLWMSWGVRPRAMIGHSIGEYVAACLADVFSLEDALMLVASRGRLMQQLPGGSMLAVPLPEKEARRLAGEDLSLAAVNGPSLCVLSGPDEAIQSLARRLERQGLSGRPVHTSHAFHSRMMEPILEEFTALVRGVRLNAPQIPYVSNLTGTWARAEEATDASYWARHLRGTVRFTDGAQELLRNAERILLEVGPGQTLTALIRQHLDRAQEQVVVASLPRVNDGMPEHESLLQAAGRLWLAGLELDWKGLHSGRQPRRVPLPTYPFERSRYWIEPASEEAADPQTGWRKKTDIAEWFYAPLWKQSVPPAPAPADGEQGEGARWLVFMDECGLGDELVARWRRDGLPVVTVAAGEQFARRGDAEFVIDPRREEDFGRLLAELDASDKLPTRVAHLWGVTSPGVAARPPDEFSERVLGMSFYSLLFLAQALGGMDSSSPVQVFVCSNDMQKVVGEEALCPEKATALGPCRVIPQEYPNVSCRSIDLATPRAGDWRRGRVVGQLLAEFAARTPDPVVAYRGGARWVPVYEPLKLEAGGAFTRLRQGGVYLITGGLGGIGLEIAEHLAATARARLILTGRSPFPAREEWEQRLADADADDPLGEKIRRLKNIEALGGEVLVFSADVTDAEQMREALARAAAVFGPVNGVVHAAGVAGRGMIQTKTPGLASDVLAPKVRGLRVLEALLEGAELDFLLLCSSVSSVVGGIGQVDYAAANFFLDAFAHYDALSSGRFTVSVNWGPWQEVGMAARELDAASGKARRQTSGREVGHPLLEKCIDEGPGHKTYSAELSVARHWVLDEHRLAGNPVLPGTAYLEMARAAFEDYEPSEAVELHNLYFLNILRVGEDEGREVQTVVSRDGRDFKFTVRSEAGGDGRDSAAGWREHAIGEIRPAEAEPLEQYDIEDLLARCSARQVELPERQQHGEGLGPRWDNLRSIHIGDGEMLAVIELPEEFSEDLAQFPLHPSLLDAATGLAKQYLSDGGSYLPLSYRRVRINRPLSRRLYSYSKMSPGDFQQQSEVLSFDIRIMDEQGRVLVEVDGFSAKRINDSPLINRALAEQLAAAPAAPEQHGVARAEQDFLQGLLAGGIRTEEGLEAFGRLLSHGQMPQVVVSPVDIRALIEQSASMTATGLLEQAKKMRLSTSQTAHPRPDLEVEYVAPRNELEQRIADIWQELLGLERVGIHDNFFELGGDSVVVIYLVARLTQAGLQVSPQHLFQYPTIAELSAASAGAQPGAEEEQAASVVPLSPGQRWFFEQDLPQPERFAGALWLEARDSLDASRLEEAVRQLVSRHDALRLRFEPEGAEWRQVYTGAGGDTPFTRLDLSALDAGGRASACEQVAERLSGGMSLSQGPLFQVALLDFGGQAPQRLLILLHHLLADDRSWRILLEDLEAAYRQAARGGGVGLPPKTASFQSWARRLAELATSSAVVQEPSSYLEEAQQDVWPLPSDSGPGAAEAGPPAPSVRVSLGAEDTEALLERLPAVFRTRTEEVLVAALVDTLGRWSGAPSLLLDLSASARDAEESEGVNLTHTLGQFAVVFPALLQAGEGPAAVDILKPVKERLRSLSAQAFQYAVARHLGARGAAADKLRVLPRAEISFNYWGRAEELLPEDSLFALAPDCPVPRAPRGPGYRFEITGCVHERRLKLEWAYDAGLHRRETVERLAQDHLEALRSIINHSLSSDEQFTPSDFPLAGLDEQKLKKLSSLLGKVTALK